MTERSRWAFPRLARVAAAWVAAVVLGANILAAQGTSGKIEGTVRDQSGAPVNGAQVFIVGTAFAAVSNERGYYFINNVPAGVFVVRSQYIGYAPAEVRNVRVFANQTMTINIPLESRAIEVSGVTVTVEQTPIVPRDQVTSKAIIQGDVLLGIPGDAVSAVLGLQPGVVSGRTGLTIRGGRPGEAATYIDGVLVRNMSGNSGTVSVGTNAIEEAAVTTGAIGAEYGEAQSGVVNLVTRAGGQKIHGNVSFATDDPSGQTYGTGLNRLEASIGGPLTSRLTYFFATQIQGQQNGLRNMGAENVPRYVLDGVDTVLTVARAPGVAGTDSQRVYLPKFISYSSGSRQPNAWSSSLGFDAKLQYTFGAGSRVAFTYHRNQGEGLNTSLTYDYNTMGRTANWNLSNAFIVSWTQNLASSGERALFLDASLSYQHDQQIGGQINPEWATDRQKPFMWFSLSKPQFTFDLNNWPITDRLIQNIRLGNCQNGADPANPDLGGCAPFNQRTDLANVGEFRTNPYGITGSAVYFPTSGLARGVPILSEESRWTGRANFDWQANRYNRVRFGGDFVVDKMDYFALNNMFSTQFMDAYKEKPMRFGLYASDRIDLGDVVIDLGLRFDRLNSKMQYPRVPSRTFADPIRTGNLAVAYTAADTAMANNCGTLFGYVTGAGGHTPTPADTTAWSTCNFFTATPKNALAPSLRVSFPVTDKTGFRLSYAHQLQTPSFRQLAWGHNLDVNLTNTNNIFGRDLAYGKTIMFEFGIRHAFSEDMVLDISAYNKDKVSDIAARIQSFWDPTDKKDANLNTYTNAGFGNVRGVDLKLDRRIGQLFQGTVVYTFESNRTTDSDPNEYLNNQSRSISAVTGDRLPAPQALMLSAENRTHTIAGNLALNFPHGWHSGTTVGSILQDFGIGATFRFASGLPYTACPVNSGSLVFGPGNGFCNIYLGTEVMNGARLPWIKNVDMRVTRGFRVGGRDLTVFADFRNLFNWTNVTNLWAETGDVVNDKYKAQNLNTHYTQLQSEAGNLYSIQDVVKNGVTTRMGVIDLTNCSNYAPTKVYGLPNCLMLRRTEQLFGNGDKLLDMSEVDAAYGAFYNAYSGVAAWNFRGTGLNIRFGFELNF